MSELLITVCICTYNRAERLAAALESLTSLQDPGGLRWELLLIDNNSSDDTRSVAESFSNRLPLRYVFEVRQGLSHARNRAIEECRSEVLLFTDDDVIVDQGWLREYGEAVRTFSDADYFGGRILPLWPSGRPRWLRQEPMPLLAGLFVWYDLGDQTREFRKGELLPYGASFALRRRLFERLEPFRGDLGVSGTAIGRGEEAEYLSRAALQGSRGIYVGKAVCLHWVDPGRLRLGYMYRYGVQKGVEEVVRNGAETTSTSVYGQLGYGLRGMYQLLKGRGDRFRQCVINMGIQRGLRSAGSR